MRQETIDNIVQSLERGIERYQKKIINALKEKDETEYDMHVEYLTHEIRVYKAILNELKIVKRVIKKGGSEIEPYKTSGDGKIVYRLSEFRRELAKAELSVHSDDDYATIHLFSVEEEIEKEMQKIDSLKSQREKEQQMQIVYCLRSMAELRKEM